MKNLLIAFMAVLCFGIATSSAQALVAANSSDLENTIYMDLKDGRVVIKLRPDLAPQHVARIKELTRQGFYNGLIFHRVIEGFMAQGGDPTGTGTGGSGQNIPAEFTPEPFVRGTLGMARSMSPNSADSQFFIMFKEGSFLNGKYTVLGNVVSGMEFVDKIQRGEPPANPDKIIKMMVAADEGKAPVVVPPAAMDPKTETTTTTTTTTTIEKK